MQHGILLGQRHGYGGSVAPFYLPAPHLTRHCLVLGKTGMGKSSVLLLILAALIEQGHGVGLLDPHGDLASAVLDLVPRDRLDDVVYLDAADGECAPALNLVAQSVSPAARPRLASSLLAAFRHIWSESWGPRLEYILYHALRVLLDCQNVSLIALPRLLSDENFRRWAVSQCADPFVRSFWSTEYSAWDKRFRQEAIAPIQNKLGQLASIPALREILGQVPLKVNFSGVLTAGQILIVNLAKGRLGEDASHLLGALLTASIGAAAMERAATPAVERRPFVLVVDEAQNFLTDALGSILSESRKFGLGLVLSHQFLGQLTPALREAVLGNVGSIFSFRVSAEDAEVLAANFAQTFAPPQFVDLPPFSAFVRPLDEAGYPFRLDAHPPNLASHGYSDSIIRRSRERFGTSRPSVRAKLDRWISNSGRDEFWGCA